MFNLKKGTLYCLQDVDPDKPAKEVVALSILVECVCCYGKPRDLTGTMNTQQIQTALKCRSARMDYIPCKTPDPSIIFTYDEITDKNAPVICIGGRSGVPIQCQIINEHMISINGVYYVYDAEQARLTTWERHRGHLYAYQRSNELKIYDWYFQNVVRPAVLSGKSVAFLCRSQTRNVRYCLNRMHINCQRTLFTGASPAQVMEVCQYSAFDQVFVFDWSAEDLQSFIPSMSFTGLYSTDSGYNVVDPAPDMPDAIRFADGTYEKYVPGTAVCLHGQVSKTFLGKISSFNVSPDWVYGTVVARTFFSNRIHLDVQDYERVREYIIHSVMMRASTEFSDVQVRNELCLRENISPTQGDILVTDRPIEQLGNYLCAIVTTNCPNADEHYVLNANKTAVCSESGCLPYVYSDALFGGAYSHVPWTLCVPDMTPVAMDWVYQRLIIPTLLNHQTVMFITDTPHPETFDSFPVKPCWNGEPTELAVGLVVVEGDAELLNFYNGFRTLYLGSHRARELSVTQGSKLFTVQLEPSYKIPRTYIPGMFAPKRRCFPINDADAFVETFRGSTVNLDGRDAQEFYDMVIAPHPDAKSVKVTFNRCNVHPTLSVTVNTDEDEYFVSGDIYSSTYVMRGSDE